MSSADPLALLRYLDIVVVIAAAPFVVLGGLPVVGYLAAAVAWVLQRAIAIAVESYAKGLDDVRRAVGFNVGALLARVWILGLAIVLVGTLGAREDGVMASVTCLAALTIYFATVLMGRSLEKAK